MFEKLTKLRDSNRINTYFYKLASKKIESLPQHLKNMLVAESEMMSSIGVSSEEDHKNFLYIISHTKTIAKDLSGRNLSNVDMAKISRTVFGNLKKYPIDSILNFYIATQIAMEELDIPIKKVAYPVGFYDARPYQPHNVKKWMQTMKNIYATMASQKLNYNDALEMTTKDWGKMEKQDFNNWLKFYQENAHMKYKTAQKGYYLHEGGGDIPMDQLQATLPPQAPQTPQGMPDMTNFKTLEDSSLAAEKAAGEEEIKRKITSIVSRLNAAERIATIPEVQRELQKVLAIGVNKWLEELQRVKRFVQTAPIRNANSSILEDLIHKQGNILTKQGFPKAGKFMKLLAQPMPPPPPPPLSAPENPTAEPAPPMSEESDDAWVKELINALNLDKDDDQDVSYSDDLASADDLASIVVEAQELPSPMGPDIEVEEEQPFESELKPDLDSEILTKEPSEDIFEGSEISITDVINRLEGVANVLKNREIPRQLSIIDLMMDKLGIASFFPSLAEANRSALESNQYMSSRIEDVLAMLRGSMEAPSDIDLGADREEETRVPAGAVEALKESLTESEKKDREKRKTRLKQKNAPPIETEEELAGPVQVEPPVAPPPVPGR